MLISASNLSDNQKRSVLTIATGKRLYINMAINLARSFLLWHADADIKFNIITDFDDPLPNDLKRKIEVIAIKHGELGEGFSTKLHLDKFADEGQTLFIDSDCLIYGKLDLLFSRFKGHSVSVVGGYIKTGEWFGDIAAVCKKFNLAHIPKFNGGIYYLEKGETAIKVFETARSLEKIYDEIGFVRLRNRPNDEVIMAVSMELHQQDPIKDDGELLGELVNFSSGIKSDLLGGVIEMYNNPFHPLYQKNWQLIKAKPVIVHYLGHHNQVMPYTEEVCRLKYTFVNKYPKIIVKLISFLQISMPSTVISSLKSIFRPLYWHVFGTRKIKKSERVID